MQDKDALSIMEFIVFFNKIERLVLVRWQFLAVVAE